MTRRRTAPALLLILVLAGSGCAPRVPPPLAPAQAPARDPVRQLQTELAELTRLPGVQRAVWGIVVESLDRRERLFELNPHTLLVPASVAKIITVASAADAVGWDYRFETTVKATGPIVDGVLRGDLIVVGSGDPTIGGRGGTNLAEWVDALASLGLRRIDGRIIADDDALEEPRPQLAWAWDDLGYRTGALFGALNVRENQMLVSVAPGPAAGAPASLQPEPAAENRPIANRVLTTAPGSMRLVWPEQRPGDPFLTIAGSIPLGAEPVQLSVSAGNPTRWFASVLQHELRQRGIEAAGGAADIDDLVAKPDAASAHVLYTHRSPTLAQIAVPLLKDSINLYAEAVMRLNAEPGAVPTNDAALDGLRRRWASWGLDEASQQLVDGSGLSRRSTISAEAVAAVLARFHDPSGLSPLVRALPVAGVDGSLEQRLRGTVAEGQIRAKTGTMSNIRTLAGYATTQDGERLAFAIMANNFEGPAPAATQAIDLMAVRLAAFTRRPSTPPEAAGARRRQALPEVQSRTGVALTAPLGS